MKASMLLSVLMCLGTSNAQAQVVTIYSNGTKLEFAGFASQQFSFRTFDSTLTKESLEYLNKFGKFYTDSLVRHKTYLIVLETGLNGKDELKRNKELNLNEKRIRAIINYLSMNFGVNKSDFRFRYGEIMEISCDGFLNLKGEKVNLGKKESLKKVD